MSSQSGKILKFGSAIVVIVLALGYLAYTGVQESKSYYVTIKELRGMGDGAYTKRLRVAGNVLPGSIKRSGTNVNFALTENDQVLNVVYAGTEPPPDTPPLTINRWIIEPGNAGERSRRSNGRPHRAILDEVAQ
jgi:cytochrome c-type biogenesis protein CcmE